VENPARKALLEGVIVGLANHTILLAKDGRAVQIDDSGSPIRDASGTTVGAVLVFRNITAHRQVENDLKRAHEEAERKAAELRRSNEDLSQFAQVASHDLRSPLNTVVQFSQLLERQYGEKLGEGKKLLDYVTGSAKRMQSLIDDLLSYARVGTDAARVFEPIDANVQLQAAVENLRGPIEAARCQIPRPLSNGPALGQFRFPARPRLEFPHGYKNTAIGYSTRTHCRERMAPSMLLTNL
jgi:signal transduction histidine kinase